MAKPKETHGVTLEVLAVFFFALGLFTFVSLVFFSSALEVDTKGAMGSAGLFVSQSLGSSFGILSFVFPLLMFHASYVIFRKQSETKIYWKLASTAVLLLASTTILGLAFGENSLFGYAPAGGWLGFLISRELAGNVFGTFGTYIISVVTLFLAAIIMTETKLARVAEISVRASRGAFVRAAALAAVLRRAITNVRLPKKSGNAPGPQAETANAEIPVRRPPVEKKPEPKERPVAEPQIVFTSPSPEKKAEAPGPESASDWSDFSLPSFDLLDPKVETDVEIDKDAMYVKASMIEEKLADFKVKGKVVEIRPGPVVTMFEYRPSAGVKISKISELENDLAMGLKAISIRIIAPIPGKDVVGIEVPNESREIVVLRELFENAAFSAKRSMLTLALGKDISGKSHYMDLQKAPHLMIAGTTGSGKSVLLNAAITSLLFRATPRELKLIMIDPKMLELSVYEDIPHLIHPVVTEPRKAVAALKWLVEEMDSRYAMLSEEGVRDIDSYNRRLESLDVEEKRERWLPYVVVVIDELADLMMVSKNDVTDSIIRLAQKARAAGIHIIVATQRPSTDVVKGLVKANFPARISFRVSSGTDSRIILDTGGAENLLGQGDMLVLGLGGGNLMRLQGAFISDDERKRVTDFLREQGKPVHIKEITRIDEDSGGGVRDEDKDELYDTALGIIAEAGQASISMIQRRLNIGYNRAARIVEIMEMEGLVGPQGAAGKPREVYVDMINARGENTD